MSDGRSESLIQHKSTCDVGHDTFVLRLMFNQQNTETVGLRPDRGFWHKNYICSKT
jgi:hypothetical protein